MISKIGFQNDYNKYNNTTAKTSLKANNSTSFAGKTKFIDNAADKISQTAKGCFERNDRAFEEIKRFLSVLFKNSEDHDSFFHFIVRHDADKTTGKQTLHIIPEIDNDLNKLPSFLDPTSLLRRFKNQIGKSGEERLIELSGNNMAESIKRNTSALESVIPELKQTAKGIYEDAENATLLGIG